MGGTSNDYGYGIGVDGSGNAYVTGFFQGTADFDPSASTQNRTSAGSGDIFVAKYSSSGAYQWANAIGGTSDDYGSGIGVDGSGNAYVTGYFQGTADFDPSASTQNRTSAGGIDIFVAKYSSSGAYQWANAIGGTSDDIGSRIALRGNDDVYAVGTTAGSADADPGPGTTNVTGGYLIRYAPANVIATTALSATNIVVSGNSVLSSGNCPATLTALGWGKTFVIQGPGGYVYSTVFRDFIRGDAFEAKGIRVSGPYTLTVYGNPDQTPVVYSFQVSGSCP
jgi:secreted PhoX family phosphatase